MRKRVLVTVLVVVMGAIVALLMALLWSPEPRDYLTVGIGTIAVVALVQNWLASSAATYNADLAKLNEERKKYDWSIVLHPDGGHYVLRNAGTLTASDVKLKLAGDFAQAAFLQHEGDEGPVIHPRQSKAFLARFPWSSRGTEIQVDWQPEGEKERKVFNEVLEPTKDRIAEIEQEQRDKLDKRNAFAEAQIERYEAECRRLLIELADAWGAYTADSSQRNKMKVQAIVGALPTNFAREIGYAVDVPRDFWCENQWPPDVWAPDLPEDQQLLRENAAMIELIWNLRQVQIDKFVETDLSQEPDPWHRIEHAVYGFRDLVRKREAGERVFRAGERDREQRRRTQQYFDDAGMRSPRTDAPSRGPSEKDEAD